MSYWLIQHPTSDDLFFRGCVPVGGKLVEWWDIFVDGMINVVVINLPRDQAQKEADKVGGRLFYLNRG